jgi:hypothetical protein
MSKSALRGGERPPRRVKLCHQPPPTLTRQQRTERPRARISWRADLQVGLAAGRMVRAFYNRLICRAGKAGASK